MKGTISAEWIGHTARQRMTLSAMGMLVAHLEGNPGGGLPSRLSHRPWVARILGRHPRYGYDREFIDGRVDYSKSNSVGSRGIWVWWTLDAGHLYETWHKVTWGCDDRFFFTVLPDTGQVKRLTPEQAEAWVAEMEGEVEDDLPTDQA